MAQTCNISGCCGALPEGGLARLFTALCDPRRLMILDALGAARRPLAVGEVAAHIPVDISVVSRHLKQMKEAGLLAMVRRGRETRYALRSGFIAQQLRAVADVVEACCPAQAEKPSRRPSLVRRR